MPRVDLRILVAFFVSPFVACGSIDPAASPDAGAAGAAGGTGGNGGMDGGSGAGGWDGAAGGIDAGDASCPSTDASPPCEKALTSDIFDPGEVYMAGGLDDGSGYGGLAHPSCSNVAVVDFRGSDVKSYIRPTDGRVLYRHRNEPSIREFHMDGCLRVAGAANDRAVTAPTMNDPLFWGVCRGGPSPDEFLISPEGFFMLHCLDGGGWRDVSGEHVYLENGDSLLHLGYGNLALTATRVIDLGTGAGPLIVRPAGFIYAIRAVPPDKFWIVLRLNADASQALFEVDRDGSVTQLGTFPTPPTGTVVGTTGRLDKNGALYQFTTRRNDTTAEYENVVMRRDIEGKFEFVYDEGSKPFVRAATLITGP